MTYYHALVESWQAPSGAKMQQSFVQELDIQVIAREADMVQETRNAISYATGEIDPDVIWVVAS